MTESQNYDGSEGRATLFLLATQKLSAVVSGKFCLHAGSYMSIAGMDTTKEETTGVVVS